MPNLRIALVAVKPKLKNYGCENPPLGLLSIATVLIKKGIVSNKDIKIIDTHFDDPIISLKEFKPDIIAFSAISPFYLLAKKYALRIKSRFKNAKIIIGGFHISSDPHSLESPFSIGVIGEGEETFPELIELFKHLSTPSDSELLKIKGIVYINKQGRVVKTENRQLITTLDEIPQIEWSLIPKNRVITKSKIFADYKFSVHNSAFIYTSRGCPYHCTFCAYNNVWGKGAVRFFSPKYAIDSIEHLYSTFDVTAFRILDDTFAITKVRIKEIITELENRGLLGKIYFFEIFIRANLVDDEMCLLLKKLGVVSVFIGIESGSQRMLSFLKKNTLTLQQVKDCINVLGTHKINVIGSFMFFSPKETREDLEKTIEFVKWFVKQKNALMANLCLTTPFPGTDMWGMDESKKYTTNKDSYLKMISIEPGKQNQKIFYYNGLSRKECATIWDRAQKISAGLNAKWRIREFLSRLRYLK